MIKTCNEYRYYLTFNEIYVNYRNNRNLKINNSELKKIFVRRRPKIVVSISRHPTRHSRTLKNPSCNIRPLTPHQRTVKEVAATSKRPRRSEQSCQSSFWPLIWDTAIIGCRQELVLRRLCKEKSTTAPAPV